MLSRIKSLVFICLLFAAIAVLESCEHMGNEPEQTLSAFTDKATYTTEEYITITVTNNGDFVAHLASCCASLSYYIDKHENGTWRLFSNQGVPCPPGLACPSRDLVVARAEHQVGSALLSERGTFRIRVPYGRSNEYLAAEVVSNTFVVQ